MTKAKQESAEWFGADVQEKFDGKHVEAYLGGYVGVDSDVPRTKTRDDGTLERVPVRKPAPRHVSAKTSGRDETIARATNKYKLMRSAFQFAPVADKETWEGRMNIAFEEMQLARFKQKLERYQSGENPSAAQIEVYKNRIYRHRGKLAELLGQE